MRYMNTPMKYEKSQRGGALLVAMVMIFMLSIMGISVMRSSTLEHRMAVNAIRTAATFQAAESASNLALNSADNLTEAYNMGLNSNYEVSSVSVDTAIGLDSISTLAYAGEVPIEGFSAGIGNNFEALVFIATGISTMEDAGTQSNVEQGAYRIVPAN